MESHLISLQITGEYCCHRRTQIEPSRFSGGRLRRQYSVFRLIGTLLGQVGFVYTLINRVSLKLWKTGLLGIVKLRSVKSERITVASRVQTSGNSVERKGSTNTTGPAPRATVRSSTSHLPTQKPQKEGGRKDFRNTNWRSSSDYHGPSSSISHSEIQLYLVKWVLRETLDNSNTAKSKTILLIARVRQFCSSRRGCYPILTSN